MAYISNPRKASLERMHHVGEPPISMGGTRVFALLDHTIPHQIQKPDRRNKRKAREMDLENYMMKKRQEAMKSGDKARGPPRRAEASGVPPIPKMQMEEPRSFVQNKDCILWRYFQCVVRKDLVIDIPLCLDCFVLDVEGKKFYGERPDENDELSTCRFKGSNMRQ